jgi:uncharacterized protein (DUF1330 family)
MAAKGYWLANNDIFRYAGMADYRDANKAVMDRYGAKFIIMGGDRRVVEGEESVARSSFTVVEFPSLQAALDCYADPEYQAAAKLRHAIAEGWAVILEGYDGPQDIDGSMIRAALAAAAPAAAPSA